MNTIEIVLLVSVIVLAIALLLTLGYIWLLLPIRIKKIANDAIDENDAISDEEADFGEEDED